MIDIQKELTPYNFSVISHRVIKYIVIHFVGSESTAMNNARYFARNKLNSSAHYFTDETSIWQSVKDENVAWHCGGGLQGTGGHTFYKMCTNSNSIGIEMCCKKTSSGQWYFEEGTVKNTVELVKYLMAKHSVPIERVIRHYDVTGKNCPEPYIVDSEWNNFKNMISNEEENEMTEAERKKFNALIEIVEGLSLKIDELQKQNKVYHYYNELPDYAYETIMKLAMNGIYKGASESDLNLPESLMRMLVILDRAGAFDE